MSISSGLYGSATLVNSDLFNDVETLKETVTTLNTTYLQTTQEHREDISLKLSKIKDTYVRMYTYVYTYVCNTYIRVYVYTYVCMYVYVCIYIYHIPRMCFISRCSAAWRCCSCIKYTVTCIRLRSCNGSTLRIMLPTGWSRSKSEET
jgi:hypothetical protein